MRREQPLTGLLTNSAPCGFRLFVCSGQTNRLSAAAIEREQATVTRVPKEDALRRAWPGTPSWRGAFAYLRVSINGQAGRPDRAGA